MPHTPLPIGGRTGTFWNVQDLGARELGNVPKEDSALAPFAIGVAG
jgi:hypothetical protein